LAKYWNRPVHEMATVAAPAISAPDAERHSIFSLLTMALVSVMWNGNKRGQDGVYPWRQRQRLPNGTYAGDRYLGHNIACVAVDSNGEVIDFDFNHNEIFSSSAEHAEARLVRRLFSLTQIYDTWAVKPLPVQNDLPYTNLLNGVTIYTSLESCAQCSGIMALGMVGKVVYLQHDPGQYVIGNFLYNLTSSAGRAPLPIPADTFGFSSYSKLNSAFADFYAKVETTPFFIPNDGKKTSDISKSITSFLCTDDAKNIFDAAANKLDSLKLAYSDYRPAPPSDVNGATPSDTGVLSNDEALSHVKEFLVYAAKSGHRGTPHK
jgi:tRNA(Arg) A34 adenosine deaminase TadA